MRGVALASPIRFLALQAAAAGQGVALVTSVLIGEDLTTGRLVRPFGPEVPGPYNYHLACPPEALDLPKVEAFRRWIEGEARRSVNAPAKPDTTAPTRSDATPASGALDSACARSGRLRSMR